MKSETNLALGSKSRDALYAEMRAFIKAGLDWHWDDCSQSACELCELLHPYAVTAPVCLTCGLPIVHRVEGWAHIDPDKAGDNSPQWSHPIEAHFPDRETF